MQGRKPSFSLLLLETGLAARQRGGWFEKRDLNNWFLFLVGSGTCAEQTGLQETGRNKVLPFCRSPGCSLVHAALVRGCLRARSLKKPSLYAACCVHVQVDVCKEEDSQRAPASHIHVIMYLSINFSVTCIFFFPFGLAVWHARSEFPDQGSNPCLLHWEHGVLITGPPGKSLFIH